jgi:D-alanyl-lipoteichoic acid acyltransferase DltB (MBOAT superfamily)
MEQIPESPATPLTRGQIAMRLLYTVLFLFVLGIVFLIIKLSIAFQYILLLITLKHSEPVRRFTNQLAAYGYRVLRYLTLNDNQRPFPFTEFPQEMEASEGEVRFE